MNRLLAFLQQEETEKKYSRRKIDTLIRAEVELYMMQEVTELVELVIEFISKKHKNKKLIAFSNTIDDYSIEDLAIDLLVMVLKENRPITIQQVIGSMYHKFDQETNLRTQVEYVLALMEIFSDHPAVNIDLVKVFNESVGYSEKRYMVTTKLFLDDKVRVEVDDTMYLPPMISKPMHITKNNQGGTLTENSSVLLGRLKHEQHVSLDVLNIMNSTQLSLDTFMLQFEEESTKKLNTESQHQFEKMKVKSNVVYQHILDTGNIFYFCHKFDSRGRSYTQGYHCNLQAAEFKKSIISLYKEELIGDEVIV